MSRIPMCLSETWQYVIISKITMIQRDCAKHIFPTKKIYYKKTMELCRARQFHLIRCLFS